MSATECTDVVHEAVVVACEEVPDESRTCTPLSNAPSRRVHSAKIPRLRNICRSCLSNSGLVAALTALTERDEVGDVDMDADTPSPPKPPTPLPILPISSPFSDDDGNTTASSTG